MYTIFHFVEIKVAVQYSTSIQNRKDIYHISYKYLYKLFVYELYYDYI